MRVKRALITVANKDKLVNFAKRLEKLGVEIISTGKTYELLVKNGIKAKKVSDEIGFPEILDGRVKTLHPKIHGALLSVRSRESHKEELEKYGIKPIDMLVCNLYPFPEVIAREHSLEEAIENIDVGGPALIRAAAKNFKDVIVVTSPDRYDEIISDLETKGDVSLEKRRELAAEAFKMVSSYDFLVFKYLSNSEKDEFPDILDLRFRKLRELRYGENPHQRAYLYSELNPKSSSILKAKQLQGKKLSFNNYLDLDAALSLIAEFEKPSCVIIKHTNPCGVASASTLREAYELAFSCDPISAFGGILGFNRELDEEVAKEIVKNFYDAILAPSYSEEALEILKIKKNLILLELKAMKNFCKDSKLRKFEIKQISSGLLVQEVDAHSCNDIFSAMEVVTEKKPSKDEIIAMNFAWKVVRHVKSNAAVVAKGERTLAIASGFTSRVEAVANAIEKSRESCKNAVLASEAFFPFRDSVDIAAEAGITAIIQPGGSIRDKEVINAANEHGIAMVFTNLRCFKH